MQLSDNTELIHKIWDIELEIMDQIDTFCRENKIRYSLGYGSLLGVVRHKGYIPWDDDLDIIMPREDYDRFIELWSKAGPPGYLYQTKETDPDYPNNFLKIRKDHTIFLQDDAERGKAYHKGFFIDIFPADRIAHGRIYRWLQFGACMINMLFTREYTSGNGLLFNTVEKILLRIPRRTRERIRKKTEAYIQKWNDDPERPFIVPVTIESCQKVYPANMFDDLTEMPFQGKSYYSTIHWHDVLSAEYGDYMTLPPESERTWKHHPILLDFDHDYDELKKQANSDRLP